MVSLSRWHVLIAAACILGANLSWLAVADTLQRLQGEDGAGFERPFFLNWIITSLWSVFVLPYLVWYRYLWSGRKDPRRLAERRRRNRLVIKYAALLAPISAVSGYTWFYSLAHTSLSANTAIYNGDCIFVFFLGLFVLGERFSPAKLTAVGVTSAGVTLVSLGVTGGEDRGSHVEQSVAGLLTALVSAFSYAVFEVLYEKLALGDEAATDASSPGTDASSPSPASSTPRSAGALAAAAAVASGRDAAAPASAASTVTSSARSVEAEGELVDDELDHAYVALEERGRANSGDGAAGLSRSTSEPSLSHMLFAGLPPLPIERGRSADSPAHRVPLSPHATHQARALANFALARVRGIGHGEVAHGARGDESAVSRATRNDVAFLAPGVQFSSQASLDLRQGTSASRPLTAAASGASGASAACVNSPELASASTYTEDMMEALLFMGAVGLWSLIQLAPIVVVLHVTGVEPVSLDQTLDVSGLVLLGAGLDIFNNLAVLVAIYMSSALFVSLWSIVTAPLSVIADFVFNGYAMPPMALGGMALVVVGFVSYSLVEYRDAKRRELEESCNSGASEEDDESGEAPMATEGAEQAAQRPQARPSPIEADENV